MYDAKIEHFRSLLNEVQNRLTGQDNIAQDGQKAVMLDQQSVGRLSRMDAL